MKKYLMVLGLIVSAQGMAANNGGYVRQQPTETAVAEPVQKKQVNTQSKRRSSGVNPGIGGTQVGLALGDDAGVAFRYQGYQATLGLNRFSVAVDKTFRFRSHPHFYWGIGAKLRNHHSHKLAARAVFGASAKVEDFVFFGELQPTIYVINDPKLQLEGTIGVRYAF